MYKVLLRNVVTGQKAWYDKCYLNGKMKRNKIILWQGPEDEIKERYKILAWQWEGYDKYVSKKKKNIHEFATQSLLELDIPDAWRQALTEYTQ